MCLSVLWGLDNTDTLDQSFLQFTVNVILRAAASACGLSNSKISQIFIYHNPKIYVGYLRI